MDAFVTICPGWYNLILSKSRKRCTILVHPFKAGECFIPIYVPFTCSYNTDYKEALHHVFLFDTHGGNFSVRFDFTSGTNSIPLWTSPKCQIPPKEDCDIPYANLHMSKFITSKKFMDHIRKDINIYLTEAIRGNLLGYVNTNYLQHVIIDMKGEHTILDMSDHCHYYGNRKMIAIWKGSISMTSAIKKATTPTSLEDIEELPEIQQ